MMGDIYTEACSFNFDMFHILCITYLLTYYMQQIPSWEANQFSVSK